MGEKEESGTFLTSLKGGQKNKGGILSSQSSAFNDDHKAMVLFGLNKESKKSLINHTSSASTLENIQLRNLRKPPIYLPELRERKDIWKGKSSWDLLAQNNPKKKQKKFDPTAHLRANKNWFLVPKKNVLLWLSNNDLNEEIKNMGKKQKSQSVLKTVKPELYPKKKSKIKLSEGVTHLKDLKKNWYSQKEHTFRVMNRENTPWCETSSFFPSFDNK